MTPMQKNAFRQYCDVTADSDSDSDDSDTESIAKLNQEESNLEESAFLSIQELEALLLPEWNMGMTSEEITGKDSHVRVTRAESNHL